MGASRLAVKVVPGASRSRVMGRYGEGIRVQVSAAPERGKANEAVIELLAATLGIRAGQIALVSGATQPRKTFQIEGVEPAQLKQWMDSLG